jgi:hypothetical protein
MSSTLINYPWLKSWYAARRRCTDTKHPKAKNYVGKGIRFLLSKQEIKDLWFRDKAHLMKQPSIDRKDSNGNYTVKNCRFIELCENKARRKRRAIIQIDAKGKQIKIYTSIREAARELGLIEQSISRVCRGVRRHYHNFTWRYLEE